MRLKPAGVAVLAVLFLSGFTFTMQPLGTGVYGAPSWSPNGDYLAFTFSAFGTSYDQLWLFDVRSGRYRKLYDETQVWEYSGLVWQNDDTLWFVTAMPDKLHSIDIISGQVNDVFTIDSGGLFADLLWDGFSFYPDEQHIVFSQEVPLYPKSQEDLFSLDLNTLTTTRLTETVDIDEQAPMASPDKQYLAFGGARRGAEMSSQNGNASFTPDVDAEINRYTWSPDGKWFLYADSGLTLISSDGKGYPRHISTDDADYVSWSPDGKYIAYTTLGAPGSNELHIVPADELGLTLPIATPES